MGEGREAKRQPILPILLRLKHPALSEGEESIPIVTNIGSEATAVLRTHDDETAVFVVNFQSKTTGSFQVAVPGNPSVLFAEGLMELVKTQAGKLIVKQRYRKSDVFNEKPLL